RPGPTSPRTWHRSGRRRSRRPWPGPPRGARARSALCRCRAHLRPRRRRRPQRSHRARWGWHPYGRARYPLRQPHNATSSGIKGRMPDRLDRYRSKRDFDRTPEPGGEGAETAAQRRFVVQEHSARSMHWDLRLEHEGTLASWAVPRGIPADPKRNHLAVRTEDHPLEYLEFHGDIPAGEYGAGSMRIYDRGTFELEKWRADEVMLTFHGERVRGRYVLFRTDGKNWMIHRMDPPEDPDREPFPDSIAPMLAKQGELPPGDDWVFEIKWDGVRAIGYV